jgi:hypothetical protein
MEEKKQMRDRTYINGQGKKHCDIVEVCNSEAITNIILPGHARF